jgi:uncharacterized protein (DUF1330 family)
MKFFDAAFDGRQTETTYAIVGEATISKGYWITCYRSVSNPAALAAYAKLAGPAIRAGGGRFLVRGTPAKTYEAGLDQRCVVIEFDGVAKAIATYESAEYQAAEKLLEGAVERDVRMVEGT